MKHIYIKLENGTVKVFASENPMPNDESMFYKRKSEGVNWGDFLLKDWTDSLTELKWVGKQDEIKTCLKLRNDNKHSATLEEYLKSSYHDVSNICILKPIVTSTKSGSWTDYEVEFNDTENESQPELLKEFTNMIIAALNGNGTFDEIIEKFDIKRK